MKKLDLRATYRFLYAPSAKKPEVVDVPELLFLAVDGVIEKGKAPGTSTSFQNAIQALDGAAYTLKFMSKQRKSNAIDYPVMPLEALWWAPDGRFDIAVDERPHGGDQHLFVVVQPAAHL